MEMVRTAYSSSQQLLRIVDDILDYSASSRPTASNWKPPTSTCAELLENVIRLMERPAEAMGLRLYLHSTRACARRCAATRCACARCWGNLISNAVKFTERGSVSVHVQRIGGTAAQHQLRFEVRDTGIGIRPKQWNGCSPPSARPDASTTRLYGGTGLAWRSASASSN